MDTRIPLMGQRPQINTPADLLSLRQLQMQVQGQERAIASQQQMTQAMKEPGMFEEDGTPSTQAVQRAMQLDPKLGEHFLSARNMALQQKAMTERAKMLSVARQQTEELKKQQADLAKSKADRERDKRRRELGQEAGMAAVSAYDSIKKAGGTDEAAMQAYRERYREEVDRQAQSGSLAAAGVSDDMVNLYFSKLPGPEEIREKYKTNRQREIADKAAADAPYKEGQLGVANRKLSLAEITAGVKASQGERKLDQADRALDIRQQQADAQVQRVIDQADAAERKAGISEEQIKERREYGQAVIEIRRLESERKTRWNDMTAEERERHNKAMEAAKEKVGIWGGQKLSKEQVDKGLQGGQKLDKEKLLKRTKGMIEAGNIDLDARPVVKNADGTISTVRSMSVNIDGQEVLIPTVSDDGRILSEQDAIDQYMKTGKHLGKFDSPGAATQYAQELHKQQERMYSLTREKGGKKSEGGELTDVTDAVRNKEALKHGYMPDPNGGGGYVPIPGGWADPKRIEAIEKAKAAGRPGKLGTGGQTLEGEELALTGEPFLKAVEQQNPAYAAKIKGIAEGRIKLGDVAGNRKDAARMANDVLRYKADWDERKYSQTSGRKGEGNMLSPEALRLAAEQYVSGDRSVVVGYGRNPATLAALKNEVAKVAKEKGITGARLAALGAEFEGQKAGMRTLATRTANLDVAARELDNFAGMSLAASLKVPRTGFKPINELMRLGRNQWSPEQSAFEAYNRSVITAFSQVAARTGGATVHTTEEAEKMLNTAMTHEQYKAVIVALQQDARQAIKAAKDTKRAMSDDFVEGSEGTTRPKGASSPSQGAAPGGSPGPNKGPKATIKWSDLK